MCRTPLWLLPVSAALLLVGCVTTLQLSQEKRPAYLSMLRSEYLSENPNSEFREEVTRGEVIKGMDRFGVLASWGYPEKRLRRGMTQESWTYVDADEASGDSTEYVLGFRDGLLKDWSTTRYTTGMPAVASPETQAPVVSTPEPVEGKDIPQN